jgi:hypothetical protein
MFVLKVKYLSAAAARVRDWLLGLIMRTGRDRQRTPETFAELSEQGAARSHVLSVGDRR